MADRIKKKNNINIKKFDKSKTYSQKYKSNLVGLKEKTFDFSKNETNSDEMSQNEYSSQKISSFSKDLVITGKETFDQYGKKSIRETNENINQLKKKFEENKLRKLKEKEDVIQNNNYDNSNIKKIDNIKNNNVKNFNIKQKESNNIKLKEIKHKEKKQKAHNKLKKAIYSDRKQKLAEENIKGFKKAFQISKAKAKKIAKGIKSATKASLNAIKRIVLGMKALIAFFIGGLWIVVFIIIIISIIAMLCSSIFGIFFSGEQVSNVSIDGVQQDMTMSGVISSLNTEFMNKITKIQKDNPYDEYDISGKRADWRDILAVYSAKVNNGDNSTELITLDENKVKTLKEIFWKMNDVTFTKDVETEEKVILHFSWTEYKTVTHTKLHIKISGDSIENVMNYYLFSEKQREQVAELRADEYSNMWANVIYGNANGNNSIVQVALKQVGNVGGQPYWSWYGFESRVEWCACFVSWCANECRLYKKWSYS